eukprot:365911-Chlamydomonas_euryale.AAC.14
MLLRRWASHARANSSRLGRSRAASAAGFTSPQCSWSGPTCSSWTSRLMTWTCRPSRRSRSW